MRLSYVKLGFLAIIAVFFLQSITFATDQSTSSWPSVTDHFILPPNGQKINAFHMVVIGDSVAWGNGLNTEDKYYHLVADWLQNKLNKPVDVTVYAHSGATISGETGRSIDPNLNSGYPTLMNQADNIQNADDVDLILISGGINDVDVMKIINVYTPAEEIDQRAQSIKDPMKNLLSSLLSKCKNAKIIVTNYYPIVSEDSNIDGIAALYGLGVYFINDVTNKNVLDAVTVKERLTENSYMFNDGSLTALTNAVLEADNGAKRITLAMVNFQPNNCYAASQTWLWKLEGLKTNDDQFDYRSSLTSDPINKINAIGHPNRDGAIEYARAIGSTIESKGLSWLQNDVTVSSGTNDTQESSQPVSSTASAQSTNSPRIAWRRDFAGGYSDASSIQQTSDGGYMIAGTDGGDVRLIKTDAKGNVILDKRFKGPEESETQKTADQAYSIQKTSDGGYIIVGNTWTINGNNDAWIIKTDSSGNEAWNKTVEGPGDEWDSSGQQTSDGEYIIVGKTNSNHASKFYLWLAKTDSNGNKLWDKTLSAEVSAEVSSFPSIQQTKDDGYIIASTTPEVSVESAASLIKTDMEGNVLWNKIFSYPRPSISHWGDSASSVQQTNDNGYIIVGTASITRKDVEKVGENKYDDDVWIIKTDSSGNEAWNKTFDSFSGSEDHGDSIQQTSDGGYVLAGHASAPGLRTWVIKTDSSGNMEWDKKITQKIGNSEQISGINPSAIHQTNDGGYITVGYNNWGGFWLVKIGGNEDTVSTANNPEGTTDLQFSEDAGVIASAQKQDEKAEENSIKPQPGIQEDAVTAKASGFGGILAVTALLFSYILWRKD
jgi:lysophospholipase L1-like esterase